MACDRLVFRRYINFLLCLYIDLWTLKNFVIINSNTSFVLILFFFIDFFSVHSKNVILLSNLLLQTYRICLPFCCFSIDEFTIVSSSSLIFRERKKKKKRIYKFYMSSGTIYHGISRFALPYLVRNVT